MLPQPKPIPSRREAFAALKTQLNGGAAAPRVAAEAALSSGIPGLDRLLGGGIPRGTLLAIEGTAGGWSIAAQLIARVTRRALAAVIDDGGLYPPTLAQAGTRLERVLVVPAKSPLGMARAADILVRSRACTVVVMPAPPLRAAVWSRLAALAHRTGVVLIAIACGAAAAPLAAAAGWRLACVRERLVIAGLQGLWSTVCGYVVRAELRKSSSRASGNVTSLRVVTGDRNAALRERVVSARNGRTYAAVR